MFDRRPWRPGVARKGRLKDKVCKVDRRWKSNAGTFGVVNSTRNKYVQIGKGVEYQFCKSGKSPFEAMFARGILQPEIADHVLSGKLCPSLGRQQKSRPA